MCGTQLSPLPVKAGVLRGSILVPVLFLIFINDLSDSGKSSLSICWWLHPVPWHPSSSRQAGCSLFPLFRSWQNHKLKSHSAVELTPGGVDWLSPFWGRQNEYQHVGILCRSGDPSRIVPNSQGDCFGNTNALHRVWSQWMVKQLECLSILRNHTHSHYLSLKGPSGKSSSLLP